MEVGDEVGLGVLGVDEEEGEDEGGADDVWGGPGLG